MLDRIKDIVDDLLAERQRRANISYFDSLSDQVLQDIGIERCDIERLFDKADPYWRGKERTWSSYWAGFVALGKARKRNGLGGYGF
jgi:uncharacterized protein YjiS (DUF1127 family)